jgi:chromosome segregation ATPase
MMDATLHLMTEQLKELKSAVNAGHLELKAEINAVSAGQEELKTDINGVKTDRSAVTVGQEELKNDMKSEISAVKNDIENSVSAVKGNISALETKINAGQEEQTGNQCLSGEIKAVSYVSDHKRATRAKRPNHLPVLRRRTQEASRERSTSVSVMSWKGKRGLLLS